MGDVSLSAYTEDGDERPGGNCQPAERCRTQWRDPDPRAGHQGVGQREGEYLRAAEGDVAASGVRTTSGRNRPAEAAKRAKIGRSGAAGLSSGGGIAEQK